jgi:hypothetical protein
VVVARRGMPDQLLSVEITGITSDAIEVKFEHDDSVAIYTKDEWEHRQLDLPGAKPQPAADRPKSQAPYLK